MWRNGNNIRLSAEKSTLVIPTEGLPWAKPKGRNLLEQGLGIQRVFWQKDFSLTLEMTG